MCTCVLENEKRFERERVCERECVEGGSAMPKQEVVEGFGYSRRSRKMIEKKRKKNEMSV
jgi:hypothetical protein